MPAGRVTAGRDQFMPAGRNTANHGYAGHNSSGQNHADSEGMALPGNLTTSRAHATEPGASALLPTPDLTAMVRRLMR